MPKISIIIPIYGVEKYIARCAHSLLNQTLDDLEFIFINDCTKDNSMKVLNNVIKKYPHRKNQIRIINMPHNSGLPTVRKYGIQIARGKYIAHCDSDDWVDINTYEELWNIAKDGNYDMVFYDFFQSNGKRHKHIPRDFGNLDKKHLLSIVLNNMLWSVCGSLTKRELFSNNINYPIHNNWEDFALNTQVIYYAKSFYHINKPLYYYFYNPESITNKPNIESIYKRVEHSTINLQIVIDFFEQKNLTEVLKNEMLLMKLRVRSIVSNMTHQTVFLKYWYSIYPEIETQPIILNKKIPFKMKVNYWSVRLHCYAIFRNIYNLFKGLK